MLLFNHSYVMYRANTFFPTMTSFETSIPAEHHSNPFIFLLPSDTDNFELLPLFFFFFNNDDTNVFEAYQYKFHTNEYYYDNAVAVALTPLL